METVVEGWWVNLIGTVLETAGILVLALLARLAYAAVKRWNLGDVEQEAINKILEGMTLAQEEFVREAKIASADGKLTKDEVKQAQAIAVNHAIGTAGGPVKDLLVRWGGIRINSIIKQLLVKYQTGD